MTRAAVYLRQSLDKTGEAVAVARQREDCVNLCADKGWEPVEYVDNDTSATNGKPRPAYEKMLADIRDGTHRRGGVLGFGPFASPPDRAGIVHGAGRRRSISP